MVASSVATQARSTQENNFFWKVLGRHCESLEKAYRNAFAWPQIILRQRTPKPVAIVRRVFIAITASSQNEKCLI
jgi:hypothetical protein